MTTDVNGLEEKLLADKSFQHILKFAPQSQRELMTFELAKYFEAIIKAEQNKLLDRVLEQKQFIACLDTNEDHDVVPLEAIKTLREGL